MLKRMVEFMRDNKRKLSNYLIDSKQQLPEVGIVILFFMICAGFFSYSVIVNIRGFINAVAVGPKTNLEKQVVAGLEQIALYSSLQLLLFFAVVGFVFLMLGHRYFGAAYAIERQLDRILENPEDSDEIRLRKKDQLRDLVELLNRFIKTKKSNSQGAV